MDGRSAAGALLFDWALIRTSGDFKEEQTMNVIEELEKEQLRDDIPDFKPGDTVRLSVRVVEGGKERIQQYEGVVIKR